MQEDKVYVAKIGKTVGLKGWLKFYIVSDFPEQFCPDATFTTNKNLSLVIESFDKKNNLIKFREINTVEEAKKLVNQELFSSIEDTKKNCILKDNQYFWFDLIGCKIIEDGKFLGIVKDIYRYPIADYFEIQTQNKTFLLPYTQQYILNVDVENKIIKTKYAFDILEAS
jgi:16S rRNA processing protein RimM